MEPILKMVHEFFFMKIKMKDHVCGRF